MHKKYLYTILLALAFMISQKGFSQNNDVNAVQQSIEKLNIYPNPVINGKTIVYITSRLNLTKKVEFFNVLGKQIFSTKLIGRELNISNLSKGVYILKITENNISETRKLVIK